MSWTMGLMVGVSVAYVVGAAVHAAQGRWPLALVLLGYTVANVGLIIVEMRP